MPAQYTGPMGSGVNLERIDTEAKHTLGQIVEGVTALGHWAKYRYVKFEDAITYVAGHFCNVGAAETTWEVTNDESAASEVVSGEYVPAGVIFQSTVPTEGTYGWVQCAGIATVLIGSANVVMGTPLKNDGTTDGALDLATWGGAAYLIVAISMATIADTATGLALLCIPGV